MKTWVLVIFLFDLDGHAIQRTVAIRDLVETACLELLANVASNNAKGRGFALCYDGDLQALAARRPMPSAPFVGPQLYGAP
jgi:hypothetical protein